MHTSYLSLAVFALGAAATPSFPKPHGDPFAGSFPFFPSGSSTESDDDGLSNPVPAYMAAMEAVQSAQAGAYNTPQPTQAAVARPQQSYAAPVAPQPSPPFHPKAHPKPEHKPEEKPEPPTPMEDPVESNPVPSDSIPEIPPAPAAPAPESSSHKPNPAVPTSAISEAIADVMPSSDGINNVAEDTPKPTQEPVTVLPAPATHAVVQIPKASPSSTHAVMHATPTHAMMTSFVTKPSPMTTPRPNHSMGIHEAHMSSAKSHTPSSSATPSPSASVVPSTKPGLLGLAPVVHSVPIVGPMLSPLVGG